MNDFTITEKLLKKITQIVNEYTARKTHDLAEKLFPKYSGSIDELKQTIKEELEVK